MSYISIKGGVRPEGEILLQGSKNATLPLLAASVLCRGEVVLENCPDISDVRELLHALSFAGVKSKFSHRVLELDTSEAYPVFFGTNFAEKTRGGVLLLGAFLGRFCEAGMAYPGGCVIGARPIDLHCRVFRSLGTVLSEAEDGVRVNGVAKGVRVALPYPSVGATENAILAAVCAKGTTCIRGAAMEPEVAELCRFLNAAGGRISGIGNDRIRVEGVPRLHGIRYRVSGDRIVAGTYLAAAAMTRGNVMLSGMSGVCMRGISEVLKAAGAVVEHSCDSIRLKGPERLQGISFIKTAPFPAFPTDMQSQTVAMLSVATGESCVYETVFESRFGVVPELRRLGADIACDGEQITVRGVSGLCGAEVKASDLRSGAALVMAGLAAEGETRIYGYDYIARGYEDICGTLQRLGTDIVLCNEKNVN